MLVEVLVVDVLVEVVDVDVLVEVVDVDVLELVVDDVEVDVDEIGDSVVLSGLHGPR